MSVSELKTAHMHGLVLRLQQNDAKAADLLIRAAVGRMEALARHELSTSRVLRRWAEAEDLLQNALLRLQRALSQTQPASMREFHALAAEMIHRETIDLARQLRGAEGLARNHESHDLGEAAQDELSEDLEEWTAMHEAVHSLPDVQAKVFRLKYYNGLENHQIAELLGVKEETVGQTWLRARLKLVAELARREK